jgi:rubrerythrin
MSKKEKSCPKCGRDCRPEYKKPYHPHTPGTDCVRLCHEEQLKWVCKTCGYTFREDINDNE